MQEVLIHVVKIKRFTKFCLASTSLMIFSYDQLLDGLAFLGSNYNKIIEIFTTQVKATYGIDTSKNLF